MIKSVIEVEEPLRLAKFMRYSASYTFFRRSAVNAKVVLAFSESGDGISCVALFPLSLILSTHPFIVTVIYPVLIM